MLLCYNVFPLHDPVKRFWKPSEHNTDQYTISLYDIKMISSPNIHIQILQTDLHTSTLRISWENLIKDHRIFSVVIILLILITLSLDSVWILLGETCCWSLLALKGLKQLRRGSLDGKSWDLSRGQTLADLVVLSFFSVSPLLQVAFLSMFLLPGQPSISNFVLAVGTVRALRQVSQILFWGADQNGNSWRPIFGLQGHAKARC